MFLKQISLQNFRSYKKTEFTFSSNTTFIVGPNTAGKTNLIEAIFILSLGKSFRAEKDVELITFDESMSRIKGKLGVVIPAQAGIQLVKKTWIPDLIGDDNEKEVTELEALFVNQNSTFSKKYLVNGVSKRRIDFSANFKVVLFHPENLELIIGSPGLRREFLNNVLEQIDRDYRLAILTYEKTLRQRNALLYLARETGKRQDRQFEYWDGILIKSGEIITQKREDFINFINQEKKNIFDFTMVYDRSTISSDRLLKYKEAEVGAGVTLVGPHRDDMEFQISNIQYQISNKDIKLFGSRGQQRLAILQLKLLELNFIEKKSGERPVFLLDDIFSELDSGHIKHILNMLGRQQTIITTTHKEFIPQKLIEEAQIIELSK